MEEAASSTIRLGAMRFCSHHKGPDQIRRSIREANDEPIARKPRSMSMQDRPRDGRILIAPPNTDRLLNRWRTATKWKVSDGRLQPNRGGMDVGAAVKIRPGLQIEVVDFPVAVQNASISAFMQNAAAPSAAPSDAPAVTWIVDGITLAMSDPLDARLLGLIVALARPEA